MGTGYFIFDFIVLLALMPALRAAFSYVDTGHRVMVECEGILAALGIFAAMIIVGHHAMLMLQGAP